ncbi:hypothetical protein DVH24_005925 [Malus domestica]|uniref:Pentatricopeptide repeat-containing protein n=1 Tax=Malus domestica TaxID=3750 RepID=A0A498INZ5_MALDO|nr:hypothetical protein DVH24_005925 [Malus domestica]
MMRMMRAMIAYSSSLKEAAAPEVCCLVFFNLLPLLFSSTITWLSFTLALLHRRNALNAVELLKEIEGKKLDFDIVTYTTLIEGLCKAEKVEYAWDLFRSLSFRDTIYTSDQMMHPNSITIGTVCIRSNDVRCD